MTLPIGAPEDPSASQGLSYAGVFVNADRRLLLDQLAQRRFSGWLGPQEGDWVLAVAEQATGAVAGGGTAFWRWRRTREAPASPAASNRDVNLDIGERVFVQEWSPNRTARVQYRGSPWEARLAPGAPAAAGEHLVSAVEGNWLVLEPAAPRQ